MTTNRVLIVAAHPDDEILGCGATMAKHIENGDNVKVVIVGEGLNARLSSSKKVEVDDLDRLKKTAIRANSILGVNDIVFFDFPDNRLDSVALLDVIKKVEDVLASFSPNIVYTHHCSDLNIDHKVVQQAVITACRPLPASAVKKILFFETLSATHWGGESFEPNYYEIALDTCIEAKIKALNEYSCEMRPYPHARSIETIMALARFRGSIVGVNAAEAFQLFRLLN